MKVVLPSFSRFSLSSFGFVSGMHVTVLSRLLLPRRPLLPPVVTVRRRQVERVGRSAHLSALLGMKILVSHVASALAFFLSKSDLAKWGPPS